MSNLINSILFVEDDIQAKQELVDIIQDFCHKLYLAGDGKEGLEIFKEHRPDIVITDVKMPHMDGIEMCKNIRELDDKVFIVFTSAYNDINYLQDALELQADGYILKPIDIELFEKKIKSLIGQINIKQELAEKDNMLIQQAKLAAMGEMIGHIAHQWQQPLNVVSLNASEVKYNIDCGLEPDKELLKECSENVLEQIKYLSQTIDDFKNFLSLQQKYFHII